MILTKLQKRILLIALILLLVVSAVLVALPSVALVYATTNKFDSTNVLDDLKSSTENDKPFDLTEYKFDTSKDTQILSFVEYCYSYYGNCQSNYGLYIYVYNPKGLNIFTGSLANKIQLAIAWDSSGNAIKYEKFDLQFCSVSTDSGYYRMFYKFKVVDHKSADGKTIVERVNKDKRIYSVSGIELHENGKPNATDHKIGLTYIYTGYTKGYGIDENSPSTLDWVADSLKTIELKLNDTFYRTSISDKGKDHQNQLNSVYFSVPNSYFEEYGSIQKILCEWYEYKTKPVVVTSSNNVYNSLIGQIGKTLPQYGSSDIKYSLYYNLKAVSGGIAWLSDMIYNPRNTSVTTSNRINTLHYLFDTKGVAIEQYSPSADNTTRGGIKSDVLKDWIYDYHTKYNPNGSTLSIKNGNISADLFENDIDVERRNKGFKQGYNTYEFDADTDIQQMLAWKNGNPSYWDKWKTYGLWANIFGDVPEFDSSNSSVRPILSLSNADFLSSDDVVAKELFIHKNDVAKLRDSVKQAEQKKEKETIMLLRFATTDYFCGNLSVDDNKIGFNYQNGIAYVAQETVFLDFDVIQLTFKSDNGNYTVIPVVANPIDAVADITQPTFIPKDGTDWKEILKIILYIVVLVVFIIIISPFLPVIITVVLKVLKVLWKIIAMPFKAIGKLIKRE